jgi:hypothetical protein
MATSNHDLNEDEILHIRMRHLSALRAGMSNRDASAYANDPDAFHFCLQAELTAEPAIVVGRGSVQWSGTAVTPVHLPPKLSGRHRHRRGMDADHLSDRVVLQALLAQDFNAFTQYAFGVVRPGVVFKPNWHLEAMAEKLSQVARGNVRRLIETVPPRHLKSLYASVALPAWFLGHYPWERVVVVCYSDFLARQHANDFRRLVRDPIYQATFPAMRLDRDTDREITTTKRGKRIATSIEGTLTGIGGNLIIIDDPIKPGDAMSESVRTRVIEWYRSTLLSRGDDKTKTRIVVVMQRVHENDLVGYLLEQGGFEVLNLPAVARDLRPRWRPYLHPAARLAAPPRARASRCAARTQTRYGPRGLFCTVPAESHSTRR